MAYNRKGYLVRAGVLREITDRHYEPGRQDRCYKWVWRKHIYPVFGIGYRTYLHYLSDRELPPRPKQPGLFDEL